MDESEKLDIAKWFSIVAVLSGALGFAFFNIWRNGAWELVHAPFEQFSSIDPVTGTEFLLMIGFGAFLTLVVVMFNDRYKRYQTTLMGIGFSLVVGVLLLMGIGRFILQPSFQVLVGFIVGVSIAILSVLRFEDLSNFDYDNSEFGDARTKQNGIMKLKNTTKIFKWSIFAVVVAVNAVNLFIFAQSGFSNPLLTLLALVVSAAFIFALEQLIDIDVSQQDGEDASFELIGPTQSGKTYSTLAFYLAVMDSDTFELEDYSDTIDQLRSKIPALNISDPNVIDEDKVSFDAISGTDLEENKEYSIEFLIKTGRTRSASINTMDYRGELISDIADSVEEISADGGYRDIEESNSITDSKEADQIENGIISDGGTDQDPKESSESDIHGHSINPSSDGETADDSDEDSYQGDKQDSRADDTEWDTDRDQEVQDSPASVDSVDYIDDVDSSAIADDTYDDLIDDTEGTIRQVDDAVIKGAKSDHSGQSAEQTQEPEVGDKDNSTTGADSDTDSIDDQQQKSAYDGSSESDESVDQDARSEVIEDVSKNINQSDKLLILLDVGRFIGNMQDVGETMETGSLRKIARTKDDGDVILMATKSDYLIDDWRDEKGYEGIPKVEDPKAWDSFKHVVSEKFKDTAGTSGLMETVNVSEVYPVFYHTDDNHDLTINDEGDIDTEGYDKVLEALVR